MSVNPDWWLVFIIIPCTFVVCSALEDGGIDGLIEKIRNIFKR